MTNPIPNRVVFVLALVGLLISALLWSWHSHPQDIPCGAPPGGHSDCWDVASSPYSRFPYGTGLPVAAYGVAGYLAIAALAFLRTVPGSAMRDRRLLGLSMLVSLGGCLFAFYLTYIELAVIHKVCKWCMGSQAIILAILLCQIGEWLTKPRGASSSQS